MTRTIFQLTLKSLSIALSLAIASAFTLINVRSYFAWYDDEGFMLMTLREYTSGLSLYNKMYTEYGPFYYVFHSAFFHFSGWAVTHDNIRILTIFLCVAIATVWGVCVWFWSRSIFWGVTALLTTAVVMRLLNREPGHPQTLVLLFYGIAFLAAVTYKKLPPAVIFFTIGAAGAALTFTKINVGAFMCAAFAAVVTASLPANGFSKMMARLIHLSCIALPAILMHRHFMQPSAIIQCAVYTFGIWATLHVVKREVCHEVSWVNIFWSVTGFAAVALFTATSIMLHGTSIQALINGILIGPLRFSQGISFQSISQTPTLIAIMAAGSLLLYARSLLDSNKFATLQVVVAGLVIILTVISPPAGTALAPAFIFIFLPQKPKSAQANGFNFSLSFVAVSVSISVLMAFPVTGTQLSVAASLVLLAAFGGLLSNVSLFARNIGLRELPRSAHLERGMCLLVLLTAVWVGASTLSARPADGVSNKHLPDSHLIDLSIQDYDVLSDLTKQVSTHCETLVTIPGMNSFHIWSGLPHPNGFIVSATMVLFDADTQERLKKDFLASRRPCVIFNSNLIVWGGAFRPSRPSQPFMDLVKNELVPVYSRRDYEIRVPKEQAGAWRH